MAVPAPLPAGGGGQPPAGCPHLGPARPGAAGVGDPAGAGPLPGPAYPVPWRAGRAPAGGATPRGGGPPGRGGRRTVRPTGGDLDRAGYAAVRPHVAVAGAGAPVALREGGAVLAWLSRTPASYVRHRRRCSGAGRGARRAAHRRRLSVTGVPQPARADRAEVPRRPVWTPGRTHVRHRRPGSMRHPTGRSSTWAGSTSRSSCAVNGSSWARSSRCCGDRTGSPTRW